MTSSPTTENPREAEAKPPFPQESLEYPGLESEMTPRPDYGEDSYQGYGRLQGKVALITGGDSGIGRAVALGRLDILVNNAASQMTREGIEQIPNGEWKHTFRTNVFCPQYHTSGTAEVDRPGFGGTSR